MKLKDYRLNSEIIDRLDDYARENSLHTSTIIENLVEKFLYDEKFLTVEYDETEILTPSEIYAERKKKFKKVPQKPNIRIYFGELDFSSYPKDKVDEVIEVLSSFSDDELKLISKNNWKGTLNKYTQFIHAKLENPSLTINDFWENERLKITSRTIRGTVVKYIQFNGETIAQFNTNNYNLENVEEVFLFLKKLSDKEVMELHKKRKESDMISADFFLEILESDMTNSHEFIKRKYMTIMANGNIQLYKQGHSFGTHSIEKINEVWDWLDKKNWDFSYSTNETQLKNKYYREWLYSQMENGG